MKKNILLASILFSGSLLINAQEGIVGINTENPKATLDVQAAASNSTTPDGIIAPRLSLAQLIAKNNQYNGDQKGAIVYVTDVTGTAADKTINVTSTGYYYFDGDLWQSIGGKVTLPTEPWLVQGGADEATGNTEKIYQTGNVAIGTGTIPTGDTNKLYVSGDAKVTGTTGLGTSIIATADGKLGIGTQSPTAQISLKGNSATTPIFHLEDESTVGGTLGKVLVADINGNGTWQTPNTANAIKGNILTSGQVSGFGEAGVDYTSTATNRVAYTGLYIDLPEGTFQVNFTIWLTPVPADGLAGNRFGAIFFSKSNKSVNPVKYISPIRSIVINPTYTGNQNDYYGSGAIPMEIEASDIQNYGAANIDPDGSVDPSIPKKEGRVRIYIWGFMSVGNGTVTVIKSRNRAPGEYGPYTQIYGLPFVFQTE